MKQEDMDAVLPGVELVKLAETPNQDKKRWTQEEDGGLVACCFSVRAWQMQMWTFFYLELGPALCENVTMSISHGHFMTRVLICADALISAVKELGTSNWGDISRRMPTRRSSIQCRRRYTNKVIILASCSCRA